MRFVNEIKQGQYRTVNANYLSQLQQIERADLIIHCMVMEHLDDVSELAFMKRCSEVLKFDGLMISLVPGSPRHWGIEDFIAGHYRRYTKNKIQSLMTNTGFRIEHLVGLTFPISNFLLPVSNFLVNRSERSKLSLPMMEWTKHSGRRNVKFKTHFPSLLGMILNPCVLWPLHLLQKLFKNSDRALVIYFEAKPNSRQENI